MAQAENYSALVRYPQEKREDAFVLTSNEPVNCFQFDITESFLVSYGINFQTHPKFKEKTLGPSTIADATEVLFSMVNARLIPPTNAVLYEASKQPDDCTANGMKKGFQEQARRVGSNGLFGFHFSGHGIQVRKNSCGLAPVDFDYTISTHITASVLNSWLHEVSCKAKYILFTLDCCYAGGIGEELTSGKFSPMSGLYVLSACAANDSSLEVGPLGHSIFTYFLSRAIKATVREPGQLPLRKIFTECYILSAAMSSLIVHYSPLNGLECGTMEPELKCLHVQSIAVEHTGEGSNRTEASSPQFGSAIKHTGDAPNQSDATVPRFKYAITLYNCDQPIAPLDDRSILWLQTVATKAMNILEEEHVMNDQQVILALLCSILYSIASIEMACNSAKLHNPNLFITCFMHAVAVINQVHHGVGFTQDQFLHGWHFYAEVVRSNLGRDDALRELYHKALMYNSE